LDWVILPYEIEIRNYLKQGIFPLWVSHNFNGFPVAGFEYRPTSLVIGAIACLFGLAVTIIIQVPRLREMGCRLKRSS
jgi:hypothetical protein